MKTFSNINKNDLTTRFNKKEQLEKAYTEGIYCDSPANRKLGRVGMSYEEYAKMVGEQQKEKVNKKEKKEIPESIQDLTFKNENGKKVASYFVDKKDVTIEITKEEKYQDKQYKMTVKEEGKENFIVEGNAAKVAREMKKLANKQPFSHEINNFRDILPLTPEELDAKWGKDYGFTYTYFKDDLDITVWKRDDKDLNPKDPRFNIYVKDNNTKKKRQYTNLTLKEAHEKLLEYDLNPNVEHPLTPAMLAEKKRILFEEKYGKNLDIKDKNYISPIMIENDLIKVNDKGETFIASRNCVIEGYNVQISASDFNQGNGNINVKIWKRDKDDKDLYYEKRLSLDSVGALSKVLDEISTQGENYDLTNEDDIKPSKDIGVRFDSRGEAYFKNEKGNTALKLVVNPEDNSKIDVLSYTINREYDKRYDGTPVDAIILDGIGTTTVDNFKDYIKNYDLEGDVNEENQTGKRVVSAWGGLYKEDRKPKDIVENYSNNRLLLEVPGVEYVQWDEEKAAQNPKVIESIKSKHFNSLYHKWNKDKIQGIRYVKSGELEKWLDTLPKSAKGSTKEEILKDWNEKIDRMKYNSNGMWSPDHIRREIILKYY